MRTYTVTVQRTVRISRDFDIHAGNSDEAIDRAQARVDAVMADVDVNGTDAEGGDWETEIVSDEFDIRE